MGEHIVKCDDPRFIPLARSRIAAIRQSGLKFGSQRFMVDGVTVTVQVKGTQEYILVEGGVSGDYVVWPKSFEHTSGFGEVKTALATISTSHTKFIPAYTRVGGVLDWVSDDGHGKYGKHCVTWSSGLKGRYNPRTYPSTGGESSESIWVNGNRIDVGMIPWGACRIEVQIESSIVEYLIFAARSVDLKDLSIYSVNLSGAPDEGYTPVCIATHPVPGDGTAGAGDGFLYLQPVYFSGDGLVFATLASSLLSAVHTYEYIYAVQQYKVSGELIISPEGDMAVTFVDTPLSHHSTVSGSTYEPTGVTFATIEHLGVDVKATGEVVVITMTRSSTSYPSTMINEGAPGGYGVSEWTDVSEVMTAGADTVYAFTSLGSKRTASNTVTGDIHAGETMVINFTRTSSARTLYFVQVYDLDARYGTYVFTKLAESQGETSYTGVYTRDPNNNETNSLSPINGDTTIYATITYGVKPPSRDVVVKQYYSGPVLEIETAPFLYSGLFLLGPRMATRLNGSFLASTSPYSSREIEATYAGYTDFIPMLPGRTLNVIMSGSILRVIPGWPTPAQFSLPEDTDVSLYPIYLAP